MNNSIFGGNGTNQNSIGSFIDNDADNVISDNVVVDNVVGGVSETDSDIDINAPVMPEYNEYTDDYGESIFNSILSQTDFIEDSGFYFDDEAVISNNKFIG